MLGMSLPIKYLVGFILVLLTIVVVLGFLQGGVNPISHHISLIEKQQTLCEEYSRFGCGTPKQELADVCKELGFSECETADENCGRICCREFCLILF
jgi:hypothetical protein